MTTLMTKNEGWRNLFAIHCVSIIFAGISHIIFNHFYSVQPIPFLDEVFHIPQATKYCKGVFREWDPKITTLPGLYLISVGILKSVSWITGEDGCGVYALRYINLIACVVNLILFFGIQAKIQHLKGINVEHKYGHGGKKKERRQNTKARTTDKQPMSLAADESRLLRSGKTQKRMPIQDVRNVEPKTLDIPLHQNLLSAVNLATFPVLYFFTYLYYTDAVSTTFVLLMYWLHLDSSYVLASAAGLMSIVIRQTNIIWVGFLALDKLAQVLKTQVLLRKKKITPKMENNISYLQVLLRTLLHIWNGGVSSRTAFVSSLIRQLWSYATVCACFIVFVILNGGLVVGDKLAHEVDVHVPQLMYFSMFCTFFCSPYFVLYIQPFLVFIYGHKKQFLLLMLVCGVFVYFNTLVHPYLLADNRHYTFYIWKRLYERHYLVKYLLIPLYTFGIFSIYQVLKESSIVFQLSYLLCIVLCLVPQKLLEFRYFIVPYLLLRLQISTKVWWQLIMEFCLFLGVNAVTIYIFLTREFHWDDTPDVQRFMW